MGQAKQRSAEIEQLKAASARVIKNAIKGFSPDAGVNTPALMSSHYWFQTSDFARFISKQPKTIGYDHDGQAVVELQFIVDIMTEDGQDQVMPYQDRGYMATVRMNADHVRELAANIARGGMSVRITGRPSGIKSRTHQGEEFMIIDYENSYSEGNLSGQMLYMLITDGKMIQMSSDDVNTCLLAVADQMDTK